MLHLCGFLQADTRQRKDASLKRCFGIDKQISDCDWEYLSTLETLSAPKQHMPRLVDLLAYLAQPENEDIWVLLDIKRDDDARELITHVTSTISSIPPSGRPWKDRIILGPWDVSLPPFSHLLLDHT